MSGRPSRPDLAGTSPKHDSLGVHLRREQPSTSTIIFRRMGVPFRIAIRGEMQQIVDGGLQGGEAGRHLSRCRGCPRRPTTAAQQAQVQRDWHQAIANFVRDVRGHLAQIGQSDSWANSRFLTSSSSVRRCTSARKASWVCSKRSVAPCQAVNTVCRSAVASSGIGSMVAAVLCIAVSFRWKVELTVLDARAVEIRAVAVEA